VVYLVVRQTLTTVSVRLLSDEAESHQIAGVIARNDAGYPVMSYNYMSTPRIDLRHVTSNIHYGSASLSIVGDPPTRLAGEYFTERATNGVFAFSAHSRAIAQTFHVAEGLHFGPPNPPGVFD
jgi:hypothetical protein